MCLHGRMQSRRYRRKSTEPVNSFPFFILLKYSARTTGVAHRIAAAPMILLQESILSTTLVLANTTRQFTGGRSNSRYACFGNSCAALEALKRSVVQPVSGRECAGRGWPLRSRSRRRKHAALMTLQLSAEGTSIAHG